MNLVNKRILITRARAQAKEFASALAAEGAQPIFFAVIEILVPDDFSALDHALVNLDHYDWLILTSIHGVEAFFKRLEVLGIKNFPSHLQVAAIGSKTAQTLSVYGLKVDHIPDQYTAEGMLSGLNENISGKRFLLPQSNLARKTLANEIRSAGGMADEVVAYHTVRALADASGLDALRVGVDIITFTSPSTVKNFVDILRENGLDPFNLPGSPLFACIGPVTKKSAEEAGFIHLVVANEYTIDGLIRVLGNLVHS
jgi:uroporphyrinogen III methyltransferase/synthase